MQAHSPAPERYIDAWPGATTQFRNELEAAGARFQVRRVDTVAERNRVLRESSRYIGDQVAEQLEDLEGCGGEPTEHELRTFVQEVFVEEARVNEPGEKRRVSGWSRKSRSNLLRTLAGANMPGHWGMITLTAPGHDWWKLAGRPDEVKEALTTFCKRYERRFSTPMECVWKLEFQARGAWHFHVGFRLPAGVELVELRRWAAEAWHAVIVHPGRHGSCPGASCAHHWHARYGVRVDAGYGDRLHQAGRTFAAYFSKHGLWESKRAQNLTPARRLREIAAVMAFMSGRPVPDELLGVPASESSERDRMRRLFAWMADPARFTAADHWGDVPAFIDSWEHPGRWWGTRNVDQAEAVHGEFSEAELVAARLVARKVVARRTWRYAEVEGRTVFLRRSLRSLHGDAGFWLLAASPSEFRWWFLEHVRRVAELRGTARARYLAGIAEPGAREAPPRRSTECAIAGLTATVG